MLDVRANNQIKWSRFSLGRAFHIKKHTHRGEHREKHYVEKKSVWYFLKSKAQIVIDNVIAEWIFQVTSYAIKTKRDDQNRNMCRGTDKANRRYVLTIDGATLQLAAINGIFRFFFSFSRRDEKWRISTLNVLGGHKYSKNFKHFGACHIVSVFFWSLIYWLFYLLRFFSVNCFPLLYRYRKFSPLCLFFFLFMFYLSVKIFIGFFFGSKLNAYDSLSDFQRFWNILCALISVRCYFEWTLFCWRDSEEPIK